MSLRKKDYSQCLKFRFILKSHVFKFNSYTQKQLLLNLHARAYVGTISLILACPAFPEEGWPRFPDIYVAVLLGAGQTVPRAGCCH